MSSKNRSNTHLVLLIIATTVGGLIACFILLIAMLGYLELRDVNRLGTDGEVALARVTDYRLQPNNCYEIQYEFIANDQVYESDDWSDCLTMLQRVQAEQFQTIEVVYLPDKPAFHRPTGTAFHDVGISRFMTACFSVLGLFMLAGLVFGWINWKRNREALHHKGNDSELDQKVKPESGAQPPPVYPLFTLYYALDKKIGVIDAHNLEGDMLRKRLDKLQRSYAEMDQWVLIEHFGRTALGEQKVKVRFYDGFNFVQPALASLGVLLKEISFHPNYVAQKLLVQNGALSFEVDADLRFPLKPILSKQLRGAPDTALSKRTDKIAEYQVHSFMFSNSLNQKVAVVHHPRYPTSGRYPSTRVLDMVQAELKTQMELQLVVPRKVGRGQQFEVHGGYLGVPITELTAESGFCIAKAIHETGLASETIYLANFESEPTLFVDADENVFINIFPDPKWTSVEFDG